MSVPLLTKVRKFAAGVKRHAEMLTFLVTVIVPLIIRNRRRPVMFSRHSGMGDIICTLPAAQMLVKRHPGAVFLYNCHPDFAILPRLAGVADRITCAKHIDTIQYRYGFLFEGFYHFGHGDDYADGQSREPMVAQFCRQFGLSIVEEHPQLPISEAAQKRSRITLGKKGLAGDDLILIHTGPSWQVREWPQENWIHLIADLRSRGFLNIAQLGIGRYLGRGRVTVPVIPGAISLVDSFTIEECLAAIASARLFVGIDSGLLHFAACTRTPSIGIFGMTLPEYRFSKEFRKPFVVNRIDCAGCEHRKPKLHWITGCPNDIQCMRTLDPGIVLQACLSLLTPHPASIHGATS